MQIYTTIGVYLNEEYKINGVSEDNIYSHIGYNILNRGGRALFVNGRCVYKGYLSDEQINAFTAKIKECPELYTKTKDTQPYE